MKRSDRFKECLAVVVDELFYGNVQRKLENEFHQVFTIDADTGNQCRIHPDRADDEVPALVVGAEFVREDDVTAIDHVLGLLENGKNRCETHLNKMMDLGLVEPHLPHSGKSAGLILETKDAISLLQRLRDSLTSPETMSNG